MEDGPPVLTMGARGRPSPWRPSSAARSDSTSGCSPTTNAASGGRAGATARGDGRPGRRRGPARPRGLGPRARHRHVLRRHGGPGARRHPPRAGRADGAGLHLARRRLPSYPLHLLGELGEEGHGRCSRSPTPRRGRRSGVPGGHGDAGRPQGGPARPGRPGRHAAPARRPLAPRRRRPPGAPRHARPHRRRPLRRHRHAGQPGGDAPAHRRLPLAVVRRRAHVHDPGPGGVAHDGGLPAGRRGRRCAAEEDGR